MNEEALKRTMMIISAKTTAPFIPGSDTSMLAASIKEEETNALRVQVWGQILAEKERGATAKEVEKKMGGRSTISVRMMELRDLGALQFTGDRRKTTPGKPYTGKVWKAVPVPADLAEKIEKVGTQQWLEICIEKRKRTRSKHGYFHVLVSGAGTDTEEIFRALEEIHEWRKEEEAGSKVFFACVDDATGRIGYGWAADKKIPCSLFVDGTKVTREKILKFVDPDAVVFFSGDKGLVEFVSRFSRGREIEVYEYEGGAS